MYGQGNYTPQFSHGPPTPPPPFQQAPPPPPPPFQQGQGPPAPVPPMFQHAPAMPPRVHIPPPGMANFGQQHYLHPPPPSIHGNAPITASYPTARQALPYPPHITTQNVHHVQTSVLPPPGPSLPPRGLPPPPPSQGQLMYRTPPPPPPVGFVPITPLPFASSINSSIGDAHPPSTPPPPPPPPPSSPPPLPPSPPPLLVSPPPNLPASASEMSHMFPSSTALDTSHCPDSGRLLDNVEITPVDKVVDSALVMDDALIHGASQHVEGAATSGEMDSMVADGWSSTAQALKDFPLPPSKPVEEEVVRNIEVLCQFIAKVGPNFEDLARTKEAGNPKFAFLFGGEPGTAAAIGHEYFQWVKGKCLLELKLQDELKEGDLSLRPSQMVTSPQPQIPSDEGVSISPAASDMDVEEANLSTVARPFNKALSPVQVIPEVTDCILVSNMPESARPLREDISLVKVSTASMEGTIENLPRPLKLIEDYSSDDSGEDDKRQCIEEDAVARDSPMVTLGTSGLHENKGSNLESNLCSENVSVTEMGSKSPIELNPVCVSSLPFTTTEAVQCPDGSPTSHKVGSPNVVVSDLLDEITKTDELGIHRDSDKKLDHRSGSAQSTLHNDAVQDDVDMDPHGGRLHQRKDGKQASTVLNVDEFGRLVREGASDSDSDGMHYTERHGKRDRSRSRSPQESRWRRRRSRSPWRRKDKRSRSRSWSPKRQRSRSRSPSAFRRAGEYGSENTRKDRGQPPVCFDFLRGRCYRGAFCRYLHRDSDKGDAPRQYRIKQREYQENPQDLRNSIVSGDTQTTVEPCEANNIVTEVSVDVHSTLLKEEVKSHEIPSGKDISDGDVISSNNGRNSIVSGDTQTTVEPCEANNIVTEVSVDEHSTVLKEEVKSQEIPSGKDISDGDLVSSNNGDLGEGTESGSIGDEFQPTISAEVGQSPATMNGGEIGQPQGLEETSTQVQELQLFQQAPEKEMSEHLPGEMPLDQLFLGEISVVHISQEKVPDSPIQLGFPNSSPHPENAGTIAEVQEPQQFQQVPMEPSVHPPENENSQQLPSQTHPDQPKLGEMPVVQISQDNVPDSPGSPKFENSFPHPENAESSSVSHPLPVETSTTLPNQLPVTQLYPSQVPPISQPYPNHAMSQAYPNQVPTIQPFPPEGFRPQPLPPQEVHLRNYSTEDFKFQPSQLPPPPQLQRPQPPVGMLPPYQLPLDNYHSQHVPPPNPSWTHLPPPPPPSANSLQFHQNLMPPSNDLNRQPMARPFPLEELTHSKVASFHPQTFVPMERSHWPPMHRNSPLGSTSFVREERFMQHAMPESKQFVPDATQNNYHLHHQDIQPPQDPRIGSQFSGQGIASSSGFNQADIHSQSVSFPRESPAVPLQSFPGNNLPPRSFSREDFGAPSQRSYGLQRPVDDGLFSHFGAPLSRYPSQILENNLPPRSSDVADSKLSTSTHFNPYASTFEQTSTTSKFASGVVRREIDTNYGNKYDPHFNPSYVSVAGQGIGGGPGSRPTALSPDSRRLRSSNSLPIAPLGELNDRAYPQEPSVHRQFVRERASADQYDPLFDSIEPSSNNRFSELDGVQMQNPNVHVGIDREVISRLGSLHGQPLDVEENNKKKEGADTVIKSLENEEFGETGIDAEVGAVENVSPSYPIDLPNAAMGEIEIDQVQPSGKKKKSKDARSMKLFKIAIADFVKEVLKPSWRQGNMSKEAFKTIVKKTVDKVSGAMQSHQIPKSQVKINQYVDSSQKKLTKLVMGYVDKYVNN